jgi:hypothetical protein
LHLANLKGNAHPEIDSQMPWEGPRMSSSAKRKDDRPFQAVIADSGVSILERRLGERRNFLRSLEDPTTIEHCQDPEYFQTLLALAVLDYGVSRQRIVRVGKVSEANLSKWIKGISAPPLYARAQIVTLLAQILRDELEAPPMPVDREDILPSAGGAAGTGSGQALKA